MAVCPEILLGRASAEPRQSMAARLEVDRPRDLSLAAGVRAAGLPGEFWYLVPHLLDIGLSSQASRQRYQWVRQSQESIE